MRYDYCSNVDSFFYLNSFYDREVYISFKIVTLCEEMLFYKY